MRTRPGGRGSPSIESTHATHSHASHLPRSETQRAVRIPAYDASESDRDSMTSDSSRGESTALARTSHLPRPSLLSSEATHTSYRGLLNVGIIVLVLTNFHEIVRNLLEYGVLLSPKKLFTEVLDDPYRWPSVILFLGLHLFVFFTFLIERYAAHRFRLINPVSAKVMREDKKVEESPAAPEKDNPLSDSDVSETEHSRLRSRASKVSASSSSSRTKTVPERVMLHPSVERLVLILHILNLLALFATPVIVIFSSDPAPSPIACLFNTIYVVIYSLKMISYACVNRWERNGYRDNDRRRLISLVHYPSNVHFSDFVYFMAVPTLSYELEFPRNESVRKGFILRRLIEFFICLGILLILLEQYITPLVLHALPAMESGDIVAVVERVLKLSVPNLYFWLIGFYALFHLWLNILAEALRFADREFYRDWWNASTLDYFWRNWNIPVHRWFLQHLYFPLRDAKWNKHVLSLSVFFVSAVLHEYIVSVSFRTVKMWAFFAMVAQIPLIILTRLYTHGKSHGNVTFWLSIILGQPIAILLYTFAYQAQYGTSVGRV